MFSMPPKRRRPCGSNEAPGASSALSRRGPLVLLDKMVELFEEEITGLTQDEEHKGHLACPFWKHNPTRYVHVKNSCTEGVGFKDIGKLTEHIRRVHCLWNGCEKCRKRFNQCRLEDVREEKRKHMASCTAEKKLTVSDSEWMDEAQDAEYQLLNFQRDKGDPSRCYEKICRALWGPDYQNEIPEPYHMPGFQLSVFRCRFMSSLKLLQMEEEPEESCQDIEQDIVTRTPTLMVPNHDPMLSQQALDHLSSTPEPFYRGQHRKDSGVWSWDHSSENQLAFTKSMLLDSPYDDDETDDDDTTLAQMESNYGATGAWSEITVPSEFSQIELDGDADEDFT